MNQSKTLDELYFGWLCGRVDGAVESENYTELLKRLHQTPFVSIVSYDENRIEDGKDLRWEFKPYYTNQQQLWLDQECSVLEMLVSLAGHLAFGTSKKTDECFWKMVDNLDLTDMNNEYFFNAQHFVDETIERMIYRAYDYDGRGGLFPLRQPKKDQRKEQLWDQMNDYILENDPLFN